MKMKKVIAILMAASMLLLLASCGADDSRNELSSKLDSISEKLDDVISAIESSGTGAGNASGNNSSSDVSEDDVDVEDTGDEEEEAEEVTDASGEVVTDASGEKVTKKPTAKTTKKAGSNSDDPAKWSTQQIVDYYKAAAAKTDKTDKKSDQTMALQGKLSGAYQVLAGPINGALKKGSTPFKGITGGFDKLVVSDLKAASAKKSGNYIIINLTPKEQTDGAYGKSTEGPVGHVVSVLDGIGAAVDSIGLPAEYPDGSVKLIYKNAFAKNIKINEKTGLIESGSWGYDVNMILNGCKLSVVTIKNFSGVITYRASFPSTQG